MSRASDILNNLNKVKAEIPEDIHLIAVTKNFPIEDIEVLYEAGIRDFGENRDQEGAEKARRMPKDIKWHFQGQIQSNKIKSIIEWAQYIHSLDELDHAAKFNKRLQSPIEVFIQVSLDGKEHRGGVEPAKLDDFLHAITKLPMINPIGLMAVAPVSGDPDKAFSELNSIFKASQNSYPFLKYLSAGMSTDYLPAIKHGATHIRLGSAILGSRG